MLQSIADVAMMSANAQLEEARKAEVERNRLAEWALENFIIHREWSVEEMRELARGAYAFADVMLEARKKDV